MTTEQREHLKRQCAAYLAANNIKPESIKGRTMIHSFWCGAMHALGATLTLTPRSAS